MTTLKDIAKRAGVSVASVSYVINGKKQLSEETTRRITEAINEANFSPHALAKSLRMGKTLTVGVLVEDVRGFPIDSIVNGIEEQLEENGYQMILNDLHMLEKLYNQYDQITGYQEYVNERVKLMLRSHVDGVIYVGMHDRHIDNLINPIDKPYVYAYSHGTKCDHFVSYNNFDGAKDAVDYLIQHGHREIAVITGHPDSFPTQQRMNGFKEAIKKAGLPLREEFIHYGNWEYESGFQITQKILLQVNRPTAIFAMNDLMAAGCLNAAMENGLKIPRDLSIIGFDNREIASYLPVPLTTLQVPNNAIGHESTKMLLALAEGRTLEQNCMILPCMLIERSSVGTIAS